MSNQENQSVITPEDFRRMIQSGAHWLDWNKEMVDKMNVFPVPDGDTGTNMSLTMKSAEKFALKVDAEDVVQIADQMAYGALMGARGNSGVILSQILAGLANVIKDEGEITGLGLARCFVSGAEYAYRAVSSPKEGTILTVIREIGERLMAAKPQTPEEAISIGLEAGRAALDKTPDLLPVLKQAGVKDAGGQGLLFILEGMKKGLTGEELPAVSSGAAVRSDTADDNVFDHFFESVEEIVYPYCTEFLVHTDVARSDATIDEFKNHFASLGDSMVVVGAGTTVKVHIHTDRVGQVLAYAQGFGELDDIKINNMRSQHRALQSDLPIEQRPDTALIVVSNGEGFAEIFESLGVSQVISGGQTMNPSTEDFLDAIDKLGAKKVFLFPNNKNIILAAEQAQKLSNNPHIHVLPTRSIPQGISALLHYDPEAEEEANVEAMTDAASTVMTGEITVAVRDTTINGLDIAEGKRMAMVDGSILSTHDDVDAAVNAIVRHAESLDHSFISLYSGIDVDVEDLEAMVERLEEAYPDLEFEGHQGQQAVYDYIVSAEM